MRLINHNRETLVLQTRLFQNQVLSVRERLQRHHNNRRTGQHRLRQLTTLAPTRIRNSGNHTPLIIKLQNRVLQLLVKNAAVGHEADGIKVRLTNLVTDANELMRQPRNSLRLPTTSTVRTQVTPAPAFLPHGRNHLRHRIPLVIPRENQRLTRIRLPLRRFLMLNLNKHELLENPQPVIPLQHVFPEVTDRVSVRLGALPAPPQLPLLNGRKNVFSPARFVVMKISLSLIAKCTPAPRCCVNNGSERPLAFFGFRSRLYCQIAASTLCVKSVFNSTVATGKPLMKNTRSIELALSTLYCTCGTTRRMFAS